MSNISKKLARIKRSGPGIGRSDNNPGSLPPIVVPASGGRKLQPLFITYDDLGTARKRIKVFYEDDLEPDVLKGVAVDYDVMDPASKKPLVDRPDAVICRYVIGTVVPL